MILFNSESSGEVIEQIGEINIEKGKELGSIHLRQQFDLKFEIFPTATVTDFGSIARFGVTGNCCSLGCG